MSLRQKFALLLGALGLSLALSIGAAAWSLRLLEQEAAGAFAHIAEVMKGLSDLKSDLLLIP
ncbi:MAG: hypothetical protein VYC34_05325, partial [Planctomycetota bacterium]|nr:hypothetical protein [Planctomycetota bacterium]